MTTAALARAAVLEHFRWVDGHADVWRLFADPVVFPLIVEGLVEPWRHAGVSHVAGVESRGFLLGGACAVALGTGFVAIRKEEGLFPGPKVRAQADVDYRGRRHQLRMQHVLGPDDRVLLVDDWAELGSQALAAVELVAACGATVLGVSLVVEQLTDRRRAELPTVTALVTAADLGPP
jgi:adenine phosphoribosyltransferase